MGKGNLLLESETFRLTDDELPLFAERMEAFILAVDKCREQGDSIYGKGDLCYIEFLGRPLYEYYNQTSFDILRERIPGFARDMYVFLIGDLMHYDNITCGNCATLMELENSFPQANNGLLGPECNRFECDTKLTVFNEASWNHWKIAYLTKHPQYIDWQNVTHPYLPNLAYSNFLLGTETRSRFGGNDHTDFYKQVGPMAGPHKNALSLELGKIVAQANFYQYDDRVSKLNNNTGQMRDVYSLNAEGKHIYLSIDVDNAAFEVCDYNGYHQGEYPLDGGAPKEARKDHDIIVE